MDGLGQLPLFDEALSWHKFFMFKILILLASFAFLPAPVAYAVGGAALPSAQFDLNDASILIPLGAATTFGELLKPNDRGTKGELFARAHLDFSGDLVSGLTNQKVYADYLRVVAIRLDPCFIEGVGPKACRRLIRLAWQPVFKTATGGLSTLDAAAHTFYQFKKDADWEAVLAGWPKLKAEDKGLPLQPHPQINRETLSGPFWKNLKQFLLASCGDENLTRVTVMNLPFDNLWVFQGFDTKLGKRFPIMIPRSETLKQTFALSLDGNKFEGGLEPRLTKEWFWNMFLKNSDEIKVAGTIQEITDVVDDLNNPKLQNTGTVDCVSCHVAQAAHRWSENDWRFPKLTNFPNLYANPRANLKNITVSSKSNRIRAFGYFGNEVFISQRVINETAEVVDRLNAN